MPELFFDIRFNANESDLKTVKDEANRIQKEVNEGLDGDTSKKTKATQATREQAKAEKELYNEFKRQLTVNEVKFRQGELSQKQALENAEAIERQAIEQGVLTDSTLRGAQAQKTMFLSQQRISTGFTGMAASSARANQSLMNLGRIVQDLPFGFLGISNNIDPALNSFRALKEESGGIGGAFKALLTSLKGSGGLIFALGSLLPSAVLIAQRGMNFYSKQTTEAENSTKDLTDAIIELKLGQSDTFDLRTINLTAIKTNELAQAYREYAETIKDSDRRDALEEESERLIEQSLAAQDKANALIDALAAQSELNDFQIRNLLVTAEETEQSIKQVQVQRDYQDLLLEELQKKAQLLQDQQTTISGNSKLNKLEREQLEIIDELLSKSKQEISLEMEKLRAKRDVGLLTEEQFRIKEQELINEAIQIRQRYLNEREEIKRTKQERIDAIIEVERARRESMLNMPDIDGEDFSGENRAMKIADMRIRARQEFEELDRQFTQAQLARNYTLQEQLIQNEQQYAIEKRNINERLFSSEIELEKARIDAKKSYLQRRIEIERSAAEESKNIAQLVSDTRISLENATISALQSISQAFAKDNKALAISLIAIEKGLAIARVLIEGAEKAGRATALGSFYLSQSITPFGPNPMAISAAANAFSQAATIKTIAGLTAGAIAAQGFGEAANVLNRGSRGGGSASGGAGGTNPYGFFETEQRAESREPKRPESNQTINISLEGEFDDEVVSVKARKGDQKRKRATSFTV